MIRGLLLAVSLLLFASTGCSISRLATARIEISAGTNRVVVTQPKDTVFKRLSFNPATGAIEVTGYASAANAAAIAAQQAQTEAITGAVTSAMASAQAAAERMVGAYMGRPSAGPSISVPLSPPQTRSIPPPQDPVIIHPFYQGPPNAIDLTAPGFTKPPPAE